MPLLCAIVVYAYLSFHLESPSFEQLPFCAARRATLAHAARGSEPLAWIGGIVLGASALAALIGRWNGRRISEAIVGVGSASVWSLVLLTHQVSYYLLAAAGARAQGTLLVIVAFAPLLMSVALAGWLSGLWSVAFPSGSDQGTEPSARDSSRWPDRVKLIVAVALYAANFGALAILQYLALNVPHGDTGMYEEHLWNFLHGEGFRSRLDDGRLFLGEHVEVIHLLLLPIYVLAPSLMTLEVCQSVALASGAVAIFLICRRLRLGSTVGWTLGAASLLYFPLQYLDMEASWKTFRPETLGVPLVLFGFAALEAHRYRRLLLLLGLSLLAKEEYALVVAATGLYLATRRERGPLGRREISLGLGMTVASLAYLAAALLWIIPYFRGEAAPHYTPYFASLGDSPAEIVTRVLTHPLEVSAQLWTFRKIRFVVLMLAPLAFLPLASPMRFLVSAPIFGYLLLGDSPFLTEPFFHFHAPLVPILLWASAGGIANLRRQVEPLRSARFAAALCLTSGIWLGQSPLSLAFHESLQPVPRIRDGNLILFKPEGAYWRDRYLPSDRSRAFEAAQATIRSDERVAATDYVRTRFTHHGAAHDYPTFRAHVDIDDVDVIVLDKTEGFWGRGPTNQDRQLLACLVDPRCVRGTRLTIRDRPFEVAHQDGYFLVVRRIAE